MKFDKKYISGKFPYIVVLAFVFAVAVAANMVKTMTVDREKLQGMKKILEKDSVLIAPERGNILSCDGQLMAGSLPEYTVYIDFMSGISRESIDSLKHEREGKIEKGAMTHDDSVTWNKKDTLFHENLDSLCIGLNKLYPKKTATEYKAYLEEGWNKKKQYYEIFKNHALNYLEYKQLQSLPFFREAKNHKYLIGLGSTKRNNRKRPFGSLAYRTIGDLYAEKDSARFGLELAFDSVLKGKPGVSHRKKVRDVYLSIPDKQPENGLDIVTTIDVKMQDICETALKAKLMEVEADWGIVVLMEPSTGDIKALVNLGKVGDTYKEVQNHAVWGIEPGSTFKTASIMVALDDGKIKYTDKVQTFSGVFPMHGSIMKDHNWRKGGNHEIDVPHTLMYSSNIGVSRLIDDNYKDHPEEFISGLHRIGIAEPLGLPIPGAHDPYLLTPDMKTAWSKASLPWMSIGYSTRIPPISTVSFYNAIANNGTMMRPRLVKALQKNGTIVKEFPPEVMKERICKESTLKDIQTALYRVVNDIKGGGKAARSNMFHISGKTGTAQVSHGKGGYRTGITEHFMSFCGFFPSEDPKYTCIVSIFKKGNGYGGTTAGPVFLSIAEKIYLSTAVTDLSTVQDSLSIFVPDVKKGNVYAAKQVLAELNVPMVGDNMDKDQWGEAQTTGTAVRFEPDVIHQDSFPDLSGMGARDAVYAIESRGMKARIHGMGKVVSQSVKPGEKITTNKIVTIHLKP